MEKYDHIISLGSDCLTAMTLDEIGVREAAYPFDWLCRGEADNLYLEEITSLFRENFDGFFDKKFLELQGEDKKQHTIRIYNTKTKIFFLHDLNIGENFENKYNEIRKKYNRRIKRLYDNISNAKNILFVYMDNQNTKNGVFFDFINTINDIFPNVFCKLLVLQHNENMGEFDIQEEFLNNIIKVTYNNSELYATRTWDRWYRNEKVYKDIFFKYCLIDRKYNSDKISPIISVILPTRNSQKYIHQTLNSIFNQTYSNFEIIIIDDDSQDDTLDIIHKYNDERIRIIQGPGKGLAAALNVGIRNARGKYLARIDADDIAMPKRFEKQVDFLERHDDISMVGSYQQHFWKSTWMHCPQTDPDIIKTVLLFFCDLCHSTLMLRKDDFIIHNFFYPENSLQEDYELWLSIINTLRISNIPEVLGLYRVSGESITNEKDKDLTLYEMYLSQKALKKYFDIDINNTNIDLLHRRHTKYSSWSIYKKRKYQIRMLQLFLLLEEKNKIINFTHMEKLHEGLRVCWNKIFGDTVIINNPYSKKNDSFINLCGIPIFKKIKKENRVQYYLFGIHIYSKYKNKEY